MLSQIAVKQMSEADLRTKVLMPLFKAMGFQGVHHLHGPSELGKDIVMWRKVNNRRENLAVVVKAGPISGQVTGPNGAGAVFTQLCQALGSTYTDPADLRVRRIHRCWVVTSFDIRKEAADSLRAALRGAGKEDVVRLVGGDDLWDLLTRYSPEKTVLATLGLAGAILENASENYRVVAKVTGGSVQLALEAKHADAHRVEPLQSHWRFRFPSNEEGAVVQAALDSYFRRGTPVTIPSKFIESVELPNVLRAFFPEGVSELSLGVARTSRVIPVTMVARDPTGREARLTGQRLLCLRSGSDELEFATPETSLCRFNVVLNRAEKRFEFRLGVTDVRRNAKQELDVCRFVDVLARGGGLVLTNDETEMALLDVQVHAGGIAAPDATWLQFAESLYFLQQKTGVVIDLPLTGISREDFETVMDLAAKIKAGIWDGSLSELSFTLKPGALPFVSSLIDKPDASAIVMSRIEWLELFDTKLPLGRVVIAARDLRPSDESRPGNG